MHVYNLQLVGGSSGFSFIGGGDVSIGISEEYVQPAQPSKADKGGLGNRDSMFGRTISLLYRDSCVHSTSLFARLVLMRCACITGMPFRYILNTHDINRRKQSNVRI